MPRVALPWPIPLHHLLCDALMRTAMTAAIICLSNIFSLSLQVLLDPLTLIAVPMMMAQTRTYHVFAPRPTRSSPLGSEALVAG